MATNKAWVLGNDKFQQQVEDLTQLSIPLTTNSYYSVRCCKTYAPVGTTDLFFESARKNYTTVF